MNFWYKSHSLLSTNLKAFHNLLFLRFCLRRRNHSQVYILGIETSCDDTGCAVLNGHGELLSQRLHSQNLAHVRNGGIIPDIAQDLHRKFMEPVVSDTLNASNLSMKDMTAIAVSVKPGLPLSLAIGTKYAKHLARTYNKPLIPIHHMEAHALVARMHNNISFPFLCLLISGKHCLLSVVNDVNKFILLGESMDIAPGDMFDKVARRMKLRNIPEYSRICGGHAIELAASKVNNATSSFPLPLPLADYKNCNFSFNGLKTSILAHIYKKEREHNIIADTVIPETNELCHAVLTMTTKHLVHRTQRAIEYCNIKNLIPKSNRQLVISGGVACNDFIYRGLKLLCDDINYNIYRPQRELCTDNGVMIAWNGLEKWKNGIDVSVNVDDVNIEADSPLGVNAVSEVTSERIPMKLMKMKLS